MRVYECLLYFFIYGFLGWCTEVAFAGFKEKRFVNRGFLNGPICPIYGVGVTSVVLLASSLEQQVLLLYLFSAVLVTVLELLTGFLMDKLFHHKWWDYSTLPFNIGGYVCLPFSVLWGGACVFIIKGIHPLIRGLVQRIPRTVVIVLLLVLGGLLISDIVVTTIAVSKLNKKLERMNRIAKDLHELSDKLGENIYEKVMDTVELQEKIKKLREDYQNESKGSFLQKRMLRAFPKIESRKYKERLNDLKGKLMNLKDFR
ncbi:putative membrane protein [Aequitasia blattaphilus]|uniref:ABC transporter permease n=1 Tax=Aequitasia blattaphilus TaxID=2949332 RepID=A0ABT1E6M2_9FIRM|nr:putative ABC transporter permease [Aequitasia blattaphilus]MCP1101483.1 putative ABC transporter permease [Aequitasia blattaphilus]MCR8614123.1 putative ABC transporter permease [Aequitasia blattaphilus]